jgi:hypothetical protein
MSRFYFIDDSVSGVGGTSLTLDAIVEPERENVNFISTSNLKLKDAFSDCELFILGNVTSFDRNSHDALSALMEERDFVKIEFDYGYCKYRGRIPHEILGGSKCECPHPSSGNMHLSDLYNLIKNNSNHIFYMSKEQMEIHNEDLLGMDESKKSVLSSCFSTETMLRFESLVNKNKSDKYAIIDGQGGWHTQAKGINESIKHAEENDLKYDLIKTETHDEMLDLLSSYKGIITMPIIHDTCPRITIEARYMGLEVITNKRSQHIHEDWWGLSDEEAIEFTRSRPKYFWDTVKCLK